MFEGMFSLDAAHIILNHLASINGMLFTYDISKRSIKFDSLKKSLKVR